MTISLRRTILAASIAVFSAASVHAADVKPVAKADIAIPDIPYKKFVLKNGLTLLVHEDHKTPVVAINTWYHVGSKNEKPGKTGFAHLFEHLMFSGSDNFNQTYLNALQRIGATDLNGTTNPDRTNYFQNVPTSMLDYALFAESDRMGHLLGVLDQKKLDLQRGVVQNEKRQGENQPYGVTRQLLTENTWPVGHPYSWTTIGSMADLDAASMADVTEWFKTNYGPNNTTLVLSGDITPEDALKKVEQYYGDIPAGPPLAKHSEWIAKRTGTHRSTVQDRVPQARIYRVWNVPGAKSPIEPLLDLGGYVLGEGKTSRLYKRLVYKEQLATSVDTSNSTSEIAGQFYMVLTARPGADSGKMERQAEEELQALLKSGPTAAELEIAKTKILAQYTRIVERVGGFGGKSDLLASCQTYTGNPDCYKDYLKAVKAATPASVKQAMNAWLADGDYVLDVQPFPTNYTTTAKFDRSKPPALGKAESLKLPAMQKATLSNGLKVVLAERHAAPVVNLSMIVDAGYSSDSHELPGVASLTLSMLDEGTQKRNAAKISEEVESLGAQISSNNNLDSSFVQLNTLKATLPQALDVYADVVLHPAFEQKELDRLRKDQLAAIGREKTNPSAMALRVIPGLVYGKQHAYGLPLSGSGNEASVLRITRDDLVKYHQSWFKPNNATLLVVGDTTLAEVLPQLEKAFGGWKAGDVPKKNIAQVAQPEKTSVYLMDKPGAQQSMIYAVQLAPPRNAPEAVQLSVVNNIFGGNFGSRINMNLREDKHWSYGVRSSVLPARGQGLYLSTSPVQADKTKEALQELVREYGDIAGAKPITQAELSEAQDNSTLSLPGSFETAGQLGGAYSTILQYQLPEDYYNTITGKITSMTPADANALAKRVIEPGKLVWVVVGDVKKIEAGVRELKLGEVRKVDADGNLQ
ncbi:M16 family metallopeptidase [Duganella phyllosphaerae]|uniref:Peptidase M16 inactive domain protein n=1 Tax=Duganella phyllosphaerae TaxID=762836 RepID=A0A1E7WLW4_9BURK|nr:pitrilysin family protein [Duganella phyllosphaerae]OFA00019.1 peptidase M16 inactive domain protein [Duganella phyllosphaerae]